MGPLFLSRGVRPARAFFGFQGKRSEDAAAQKKKQGTRGEDAAAHKGEGADGSH